MWFRHCTELRVLHTVSASVETHVSFPPITHFAGPSATNLIIGSIAGAILVAAIVLGGTGWGFK